MLVKTAFEICELGEIGQMVEKTVSGVEFLCQLWEMMKTDLVLDSFLWQFHLFDQIVIVFLRLF